MARPDWLDFSAIGMSGLCLVHCLASGLFVASLSAVSLSAVTASHAFHLYALFAAVPLAAWALGRGWRRQRRAAPLVLGAVGLALMTIGVLPSLAGVVETVLTVTGVTVLALGHFLNWRGRQGGEDSAPCSHAEAGPAEAAAACACLPAARAAGARRPAAQLSAARLKDAA